LICRRLAEKSQRGGEERCSESRRQDLYSLSRSAVYVRRLLS
jgi:hypothetical protein